MLITTIILYSDDATTDYASGLEMTISGWGVEKEGSGIAAQFLQVASVPIISREDCEEVYHLTSSMFCAGKMETGGVDGCQGDVSLCSLSFVDGCQGDDHCLFMLFFALVLC